MTDPARPDDERFFSPALALVAAARDVEVRLAGLLEPHGLTMRKYALLARVASTPGVSLPDLARGARATEESTAALVRALVQGGRLRATTRGGRPEQITLTADGGAVLDLLRGRVAALDDELLAAPGGEALASALAGLEPPAQRTQIQE